ncbi:MAG: DUF488 domain-containing protein [Betaproteobacteria bacterium]
MLRVVRLGTPRAPGEGLRLGTVRHLPRGVRKQDYARRDFFDGWLPELAPSAALFKLARSGNLADAKRWSAFSKKYATEMRKPAAQRLLVLLARMSEQSNLSVGCYCEDEARCHRSLLKKLLARHGALLA